MSLALAGLLWLGDSQLDELADLKIIDDGRYCVRLYKAGHIKPSNINAIGQKLAAAGVRDASYYPEGMHSQKREEWRDYLQRIREQAERGEILTDEQYSQRKTTLPMSIGSAGYDTQLDYVVKGVIPANGLAGFLFENTKHRDFSF